MKLMKAMMVVMLAVCSVIVKAQTTTSISDEDLKKYAATMDSVKVMQETLTQIVAENVQKNQVMPVSRYNELFKIANDEAKLAAANATEDEKAFLKEIAALREYNIARINSTYQSLAKDYVGAKTFNAIKKGLETDPQLKARYEGLSQETGKTSQPAVNKGK
jgi:Skp family chaperone for outer membrane proteins